MAEEDKKEKVELDRLKLPKAQARNNSEETEASIQQLHSDGLQKFLSNPAERVREAYWHPNSPTEFTHDEMMVYKECNNEAFYYRGAPAALIVGSLTTFAAMSEKIKPGRFGYIPKILALSGVAFIFGKLSYGEQCTQKFLEMESTKYGNQAKIIREARGMPELIDPNIITDPETTQPYEQSQETSLPVVSALTVPFQIAASLEKTPESTPKSEDFNKLQSKNKYGDVGYEHVK